MRALPPGRACPARASSSARDESARRVGELTARHAAHGTTPQWPDVLQFGGDDRIVLTRSPLTAAGSRGVTAYDTGLTPDKPNAVCRGTTSCTSPTPTGFMAARDAHEEIATGGESSSIVESPKGDIEVFSRSGKLGHAGFMEQVQGRLATLLAAEPGSAVFFAPSGAEAEYWPLLMAKAFAGEGGKVVNVVSGAGEISSGATECAGGLHPRDFAAFGSLEDSTAVEAGAPIAGLADDVRVIEIPAREANGSVVDPQPRLRETVAESIQSGEIPVVHVVAASATGIRHDLPADDLLSMVYDSGGVVVVDATQLRCTPAQVSEWVGKDAVVLVSTSHFFRAPPINGAAIASPRVMDRLEAKLADATTELAEYGGAVVPPGLRSIFSVHELPAQRLLPAWRDGLGQHRNAGLAVRWAAGLAEMEHYERIVPPGRRAKLKSAWRDRFLQLLDDAELTAGLVQAGVVDSDGTDSIVCVRLRRNGDSDWLNLEDLRRVRSWLVEDLRQALPTELRSDVLGGGDDVDWPRIAAKPITLGVAVGVGSSGAVLPVSLGSDTMCSLITNPDRVEEDDTTVIRKLALCAAHFEELAETMTLQ